MSEEKKNIDVKMIPTKQDHHILIVNGNQIGEFEVSDYRQLLEVVDDAIGSGIRTNEVIASND